MPMGVHRQKKLFAVVTSHGWHRKIDDFIYLLEQIIAREIHVHGSKGDYVEGRNLSYTHLCNGDIYRTKEYL
jgi:hypothetical protein